MLAYLHKSTPVYSITTQLWENMYIVSCPADPPNANFMQLGIVPVGLAVEVILCDYLSKIQLESAIDFYRGRLYTVTILSFHMHLVTFCDLCSSGRPIIQESRRLGLFVEFVMPDTKMKWSIYQVFPPLCILLQIESLFSLF